MNNANLNRRETLALKLGILEGRIQAGEAVFKYAEQYLPPERGYIMTAGAKPFEGINLDRTTAYQEAGLCGHMVYENTTVALSAKFCSLPLGHQTKKETHHYGDPFENLDKAESAR